MPAVPLDPVACIAQNLQQERLIRELTLAGLAESSGIPSEQLAALESGTARPTIDAVWRLARVLDVPFGQLVRQPERDAAILQDDGVGIRLIDRQSGTRIVETYLMTLQPHATRLAHAHGAAIQEHVTVLRGALIVGPSAQPTLLAAGQSVEFSTGTDHVYRSVDQPTAAMVTVVYPESSKAAGDYEHLRAWPQQDEDWDRLTAHVMHQQLEVAHGVDACRIRFEGCPVPANRATARLAELLSAPTAQRQAATAFAVCEQQPAVILLSHPHSHATLAPRGDESAVLADAIALVNRLAAPPAVLDCDAIQTLQRLAEGPCLTHATLAAQLLTRHGLPCVPVHIEAVAPDIDAPPCADGYAALELLHPGHARQCVATAHALHDARLAADLHILHIAPAARADVSLAMLRELCPMARVTALAHSPTAFAHLQRSFAADPRVHPVHAPIAHWQPTDERPFDCAIVMGASLRIDAAGVLQSVRRHLPPGAHCFVADDMVAPFTTALERRTRLLAHQLQYVADTLVEVPLDAMSETQAAQVRKVRNDVPTILFETRAGMGAAAADRARQLLKAITPGTAADTITHPLLAFHRFHAQTLEGLVARLDDDVGRITHPRRFAELAWHAGFEVRDHRRLYSTVGDSRWAAGTHLFMLTVRRPCT